MEIKQNHAPSNTFDLDHMELYRALEKRPPAPAAGREKQAPPDGQVPGTPAPRGPLRPVGRLILPPAPVAKAVDTLLQLEADSCPQPGVRWMVFTARFWGTNI